MADRKRRKIKKFTPRMQGTLFAFMGIIVLTFIFLIVQIGKINKNSGEKYKKKAFSQQSYVNSVLQYKRGDILDRNNTKLATSRLLYNVIVSPYDFLDDEDTKTTTIAALCSYFEIEEQEVQTLLTERPKSKYYIIRKEVSKDKVDDYKEMLEQEKKRAKKENDDMKINKNAVYFEKNYKRTYPLSNTACSVVGFSSADNSGLWGLENQYNDILNGLAGRSYGYYSSDSSIEKTVKAAKNGKNIVTTLDVNIQNIVEKTIKHYMKKYNPKNIAVLVMNPKNGEIYAMSSDVTYDLNNAFDLTNIYSEQEIAGWSEKEKSQKLNEMWQNYCIAHAYEPGSTFKPITVCAALEEGIANNNSTFYCDGFENISGVIIRCVSRNGHGNMTLKTSIMESCNDVMMQLVNTMGKKKFMEYEKRFNIGLKTGIDLPGENPGSVFTEDKLGPTELATSSFGQGLQTNMVQIASAFSSIINGGYYYQPHVVKQILDDEGNVVENIEPTLVRKTVSKSTSDYLKDYLLATVEDGTGATAQIPGYSIGGKTGTAQKLPRTAGKHLVSFIGGCPMNDPEVVVYAIMDEPGVADDAHSTYAQEVARSVMKEIFPFLGIYKSKTTSEENGGQASVTAQPTVEPTTEPTAEPTVEPTVDPQDNLESADENENLPIAQ